MRRSRDAVCSRPRCAAGTHGCLTPGAAHQTEQVACPLEKQACVGLHVHLAEPRILQDLLSWVHRRSADRQFGAMF